MGRAPLHAAGTVRGRRDPGHHRGRPRAANDGRSPWRRRASLARVQRLRYRLPAGSVRASSAIRPRLRAVDGRAPGHSPTPRRRPRSGRVACGSAPARRRRGVLVVALRRPALPPSPATSPRFPPSTRVAASTYFGPLPAPSADDTALDARSRWRVRVLFVARVPACTPSGCPMPSARGRSRHLRSRRDDRRPRRPPRLAAASTRLAAPRRVLFCPLRRAPLSPSSPTPPRHEPPETRLQRSRLRRALLHRPRDIVRLDDYGPERPRVNPSTLRGSAVFPLFALRTLLIRHFATGRRELLAVARRKFAARTIRAQSPPRTAEYVGLPRRLDFARRDASPRLPTSHHLFLAETSRGRSGAVRRQRVIPVRLPFAEAVRMAREGKIHDGSPASRSLLADAASRAVERVTPRPASGFLLPFRLRRRRLHFLRFRSADPRCSTSSAPSSYVAPCWRSSCCSIRQVRRPRASLGRPDDPIPARARRRLPREGSVGSAGSSSLLLAD